MLCAPNQLSCSDVVCNNGQVTFSVCKYISDTQITTSNQTLNYTSCADTSHFNCDSPVLATCLTLKMFVATHGLNTTNTADLSNNAVVCSQAISAKIASSSATNPASVSTTANNATKTSFANANQAVYTMVLALICLMIISVSRRI